MNNQEYYIRDLPAKSKGKVKISISGAPEGTYTVEIYKVGYHMNDPYSTYLTMSKPNQLTKHQVEQIKKLNDGSPVSHEIVNVKTDAVFLKELDFRENDVFLLNLIKH